MKEIEVKAKLNNKAEVIKKLEALGCKFEPIVTQKDEVYVVKVGSTLDDYLSNPVFLRIRVVDDSKALFTAKNRLRQLDAIEHEVIVDSVEEMRQALLIMGYEFAVQVNKTRLKTYYNGLEVCIDEVEDLGTFIEMEKLIAETDSKTEVGSQKIQEELFSLLVSFGVKMEDRVMKGYDILMLEKQYSRN